MIRPLSLNDIRCVAFEMAREMMSWNEPIPEFDTRYPNVLESCLATPFQTFNKKNLYKGLVEKAAILFYLLIKNHPFENGNKRIAVTSLFIFLYLNKKWIKTTNQELYNFALWVAISPPIAKDQVVEAIGNFIKKNISDFA
jgi:death-on-curing family protein